MDLDFLTGGPVYDSCIRPCAKPDLIKHEKKEKNFSMPNLNEILGKLLASHNIASKEWVIRQYDHEVRGNTVIKPLQGKINIESHGDATVLKPLENSYKGIAVTADVNPRFMERDPYWGACSAVDEVCRNLIAVGSKPDSLLDCLNFGNPEKPERMGEFYEACRGLGDIARELKLPFVSGNVSFYNESLKAAVPPTPELVGAGLVTDIRKCITTDFKKENNPLYLIGNQTKKELGGSEYYKIMDIEGGSVPKTDINILKHCMNGILATIEKEYIFSCHDVSEGGIYIVRGANLVLGPWKGLQATEHTKIPVGKGICGSAAKNCETEIVPNVNEDDRYLSCFVTTRSEIVVPIKKNGKVIGEIDIDSDISNAFDEKDANFLEEIADVLSSHIC